jgi:hypothetical protein
VWTSIFSLSYHKRGAVIAQSTQSGDRIPVGGRFSASAQTGPVAHPASYTMGTGSFQGVRRPGRGVDHPHHLAPGLKEE